MQFAFARRIRNEDFADFLRGRRLDVEHAGAALGLDKSDDASLMAVAFLVALGALRRVAVVGFVGLYALAFPAHRRWREVFHGFAQAMHHEPSGFVSDAERAMYFVSRDAVLAGIEHMRSHPPLCEGNFAALEHGSDRDGELLLALQTITKARTMRLLLASNERDTVGVGVAAMRADRAIGPADAFKRFTGFVFVLKDGVLENGGHMGDSL